MEGKTGLFDPSEFCLIFAFFSPLIDDGSIRVWKNSASAEKRREDLVTAWQALPEVLPTAKAAGVVFSWEAPTQHLVAAGDAKIIRVWNMNAEMKVVDIPTRSVGLKIHEKKKERIGVSIVENSNHDSDFDGKKESSLRFNHSHGHFFVLLSRIIFLLTFKMVFESFFLLNSKTVFESFFVLNFKTVSNLFFILNFKMVFESFFLFFKISILVIFDRKHWHRWGRLSRQFYGSINLSINWSINWLTQIFLSGNLEKRWLQYLNCQVIFFRILCPQ